MSKNALVLDDHHGDNGTVTAGMILRDVSTKRFEELEKKGLVREATATEVKAGDQHPFEKDDSGTDDADEAGEKQQQEPANKKAKDPENKGA